MDTASPLVLRSSQITLPCPTGPLLRMRLFSAMVNLCTIFCTCTPLPRISADRNKIVFDHLHIGSRFNEVIFDCHLSDFTTSNIVLFYDSHSSLLKRLFFSFVLSSFLDCLSNVNKPTLRPRYCSFDDNHLFFLINFN